MKIKFDKKTKKKLAGYYGKQDEKASMKSLNKKSDEVMENIENFFNEADEETINRLYEQIETSPRIPESKKDMYRKFIEDLYEIKNK
ncbi:hypothetical protein ACFL56_02350 [Candidatus Margulisiibacteriota bacterium]